MARLVIAVLSNDYSPTCNEQAGYATPHVPSVDSISEVAPPCRLQEVAILKLQKVGFTYPGTDRRVLSDVTLRCTLNSRIAVLGVRHCAPPTLTHPILQSVSLFGRCQ